jgi:4-amino-4-deoxy-L-arabinose transferase-like glycosyltransferase
MNKAEKRNKRVYIDIAAVFGLAILVTLPILLFGVPRGNDLPQHYQFAVTFRNSFNHGEIYPSWSPDVNAGFGDAGVRFYPPLAYYVLELFEVVFGNWLYATAATVCLLFFTGGVGVYFWCREWFGHNSSLIAGLVYTLAPYHVNEIYNAFTFAEFAGAAMLPFCFLFATRVCMRNTLSDCLGLTLSLALLVLTNLPLAIIGSISLFAYTLVFICQQRSVGTVVSLTGSVAFGMLLSAFYWVKVVSELPYISHLAQDFTSLNYDFRNNFVWSFFYSSAEQYSERSLAFVDLMLLITLGMTIPCGVAFYLYSRKEDRRSLAGVLAVLLLGVFFATPISVFVWERIDLLQRIQFPWRWMAILSLASCVIVAAGVDHLKELFASRLRPLGMVITGLIVAAVVFTVAQVIKPAIFIEPKSVNAMVEDLATDQSCECWWPIWAKKQALGGPMLVTSGERTVEIELRFCPSRDVLLPQLACDGKWH